MARLTKKQEREIKDILYHLERTRKHIARPDIAIGVTGRPATTTLHYTRADGSTFYAEDKEIGSDLTGLEFAERMLTNFLRTNGTAYVSANYPPDYGNSEFFDDVSDADPGL